jgi:hypothetical protein
MLLLSAFVFINSAGFPPPRQGNIGVAVFPRILATALSLFAIIRIGRLLMADVSQAKEADYPRGDILFARDRGTTLLFGSIPLFLGYVLLLDYLGFIISSFLFLLFLTLLYGERRPLLILLFPAGFTFVLWFLFSVLATVPLPRPFWS